MVITVHHKMNNGSYSHAATLTAPDHFSVMDALEYAFASTNHIDYQWWDNPGVIREGTSFRSTSVGDRVNLNGELWECAPVGWNKVDNHE